jgi:DNA mismatch repair ATPase MutS
LYSGTNPKEATKSAFAFLKYLSRYDQVDFLLTTHYTQVCEDLEKEDRIQVCQMMVESDIVDQDGRASPGGTDVDTNAVHRFTYRIEPGISHVEGATQILTSMGYPAEILASMRESKPAKSTQIEVETTSDQIDIVSVCKKSRVSHKPQKKVRQ